MLNQKLQLKLSQKLSPQQIQLMKLIQLSTLEFEQRLSREIEENPALDTVNESQEIDNDNFEFNEDSEKQEKSDDEIDISEYLSDDDTPDYNLKSNNYSEENERPFLMQQELRSINFLKINYILFLLIMKTYKFLNLFYVV